MADPTRENEIAERMLLRLPEQFKNKPRLEALIRALANQCQHVEQMLWDLYTRRWIDDAEDNDLDNLGDIVGEPRNGSADDLYRQYIRARIKVNRSDGQLGQLLEILKLLLVDAVIQVREHYPAALVLEPTEPITLDAKYVNDWFLQKAKAAGVRLGFVERTAAESASLIFDDDTSPFVDGATQGFSDAEEPSTAGLLASRYG
jgi:hypothetical protein